MAESREWASFVESITWFVRPGASVEVGSTRPADADGIDGELFPGLRQLVGSATSTPVSVNSDSYVLLSWDDPSSDGLVSWLCMEPGLPMHVDVHPDHARLLEGFGGVIERGHEPTTWLLNCNDVSTARVARTDASFIDNYDWIMEGAPWPIDPPSYSPICREANGNTTFCHKVDGDVVLFAPDHSFDHIDVLEGCPPSNSLYRIRDAARRSVHGSSTSPANGSSSWARDRGRRPSRRLRASITPRRLAELHISWVEPVAAREQPGDTARVDPDLRAECRTDLEVRFLAQLESGPAGLGVCMAVVWLPAHRYLVRVGRVVADPENAPSGLLRDAGSLRERSQPQHG